MIFSKTVELFGCVELFIIKTNCMSTNNTANGTEIRYDLPIDTREKMSLKKKGDLNPMSGKQHSPETIRKMRDSQTKRWQELKAFEEAEKLSCIKRIWNKERYQGFEYFLLVKCHDSCGLYIGLNLKTREKSYRVYYYQNDTLMYSDFDHIENAEAFYNQHFNPFIEIIVNEAKNKVVVLGFHS